MPKLTKYPKLRTHVRRGQDGRVRVHYFYDMRGTGLPDVALGREREEALRIWDELHNQRPRIKGTLEEAFQRWEAEALPGYENAGTKRNYTAHLKTLRANGVGRATWEGVTFPQLCGYLDARSAKTQGNRELALLSIIWHFARRKGLTEVMWPAQGEEKTGWKNKEAARQFSVSDALFAAVYESADQTLRDCMDLATSTGMRLTDCRTVLLPPSDLLRLNASKTGKGLDFDVTTSPILSGLIERRRGLKASHLMLLSTPDGKPITMQMLRSRWDNARTAAAKAHPELAGQIEAMYLRDMRKRAADLAGSVTEASKLLQHSSEAVTRIHYRMKAEKVKPVR